MIKFKKALIYLSVATMAISAPIISYAESDIQNVESQSEPKNTRVFKGLLELITGSLNATNNKVQESLKDPVPAPKPDLNPPDFADKCYYIKNTGEFTCNFDGVSDSA